MTPFHIPDAWRLAVESIERNRSGRILVLGAPDRGKSTFCAYLAWHLLHRGHQPAYVDADVGQKDIGPPATISLGYPRLDRALQELPPAALYFVGAVTPVAHLLPMVVGTRQLVERAGRAFIIINTSGLVTGVGQILKTYQIDLLRPDVIVALEQERELEAVLAAHRHFAILRLSPSPRARGKSTELRRLKRQEAFCHYFRSAREFRLHLDDLTIQRLPIDSFRHWQEILTPNRLCALADRNQQVTGLALIRRFDPVNRHLTLFSPAPSPPAILQLGDLHLRLD